MERRSVSVGSVIASLVGCCLLVTACHIICAKDPPSSAEAAVDARLSRTVIYLASDELEGRGLGSHGLDLAADYIAEQFRQAGLKTDLYDGTPFQKFTVPAGSPHGDASPHAPGGDAKTESNAKRIDAKNVVGVLEGRGLHADEAIVVGAHYDHLGRGESGSLEPDSHEIHHGADDNASGLAALVEVARRLAGREKKLPRRDCIYRLYGRRTRAVWQRALRQGPAGAARQNHRDDQSGHGRSTDRRQTDRLRRRYRQVSGTPCLIGVYRWNASFKVTRHPEGFGPSDHSSFYAKQIPVLFFFTGTHAIIIVRATRSIRSTSTACAGWPNW